MAAEIDPQAAARADRVAAATSLAGGLTVLAGAMGLFGGLTGGIARLARNYPVWAGVAIGLVTFSVVLALMARLVAAGTGDGKVSVPTLEKGAGAYVSTVMLWVSAVLLGLGLLVAAVFLILTIDRDDRPSVSAQNTRDGTTGVASVAGTAKAGGLAADDAIRVVVISYEEGETEEGTQLYYAVIGPNSDGVVDHSFTVILPTDARSVVVTSGKSSSDSNRVRACRPEGTIEEPVDPANPVEVTADDELLTACALIYVPAPPPPTVPAEISGADGDGS